MVRDIKIYNEGAKIDNNMVVNEDHLSLDEEDQNIEKVEIGTRIVKNIDISINLGKVVGAIVSKINLYRNIEEISSTSKAT